MADINVQQELRRAFLRAIPEAPSSWRADRGIVICAGGVKYFTCAWVCAARLRALGCRLPIQFWHLGKYELDERMAQVVGELDVECVDARLVSYDFPVRILGGWELKPYSIIHSPYREVLFLDADNVPVRDPSFLFEENAYKRHGALFWPDYGRLGPERDIWRICEVDFQDEPEFESGQVLVDKSRCWKALQMTMHLNEFSDFYYRYIHGDKETFHMAWRICQQEYGMVSWPIRTLPGVMCQHDPRGGVLFQHRNLAKWRLQGPNPRIAGFLDESKCFEALQRLGERWDGQVIIRNSDSPSARHAVDLILKARIMVYERVGYDMRPMEFLPDGIIGTGGDRMERRWCMQEGPGGSLELSLLGEGLTCVLSECTGNTWSGRWIAFERMPVVLSPFVPSRSWRHSGGQ